MKVRNRDELKNWRTQSELKSQTIYNMDCLEGLRMIPDKSVDVVISDPPYELELKDRIRVRQRMRSSLMKLVLCPMVSIGKFLMSV